MGMIRPSGDYFNLTINEEEAAVVRQIYQWYIKDGYGAAKISIFLNERGLQDKAELPVEPERGLPHPDQ